MGWPAMKWATEQAPILLTAKNRRNSTAAHVLLILAYHSNNDWAAWPSLERIQAETGLSESTIRDALTALETGRLIEREEVDGVTQWKLDGDRRREVSIQEEVQEAMLQRKEKDRARQEKHRAKHRVTVSAGVTVTLETTVTEDDVTPRTTVTSHRTSADVTPNAGVTHIRIEPPEEPPEEPRPRRASRKRTPKKPVEDQETRDSFEAWWVHYPRKVDKQDALRAYVKASGKVSHQELLDAIKAHAAYWKRVERTTEGTPHPTTWLNKARWQDELPADLLAPVTDPRKLVNDCWKAGSVKEILPRFRNGYEQPDNPGTGNYWTDVLMPYNQRWIKENAHAIAAAFSSPPTTTQEAS